VVGSAGLAGDSDSVVFEHEKGHKRGYEKRNERDKDRVEEVAEPGRAPSGHVVGVVLLPHEVAGTEGDAGLCASRNAEGVGLNPASGLGGNGSVGNSRASQGLLVEEDRVVRVYA